MKYISDKDWENAENAPIGGKAANLFKLAKLGFNVPNFAVIPADVLVGLLPPNTSFANILESIDQIIIPDQFLEDLTGHFPDTTYFAVRSSGLNEDGGQFSFAGQYESYLFVEKKHLAEKIKQVWASAFAERVDQYRTHNGLERSDGIAVIVQRMINAEVSGVGFGMHPVTGNQNQKLISAVYGLGEGIVSGELDADSYLIENGNIIQELVVKPYKIVANIEKGGTKKVLVDDQHQEGATLDTNSIRELSLALDRLHDESGHPQDIEFAISNNELFFLQTRPITKFTEKPTDGYILWDNSNIIESYPGVTTPLTFSFISRSYEVAYRLFSGYLGVSEKVLRENERVFSQTLGFINGSVYYNLKTWYHMLAMLPGYSINARFMEKMMGVKEQFDIPETYRLSKGKAWRSIIKMGFSMYRRFQSLPRKRKEFVTLLDKTISHYKKIDYAKSSINELLGHYLTFEKTLLNEWKAPLLNDFFAMIWFGMLQKQCETLAADNPNIHNDLLCGSSDIISTQPVHRSIELATAISSDITLRTLFIEHNEKDIWQQLTSDTGNYGDITQKIEAYISDFGERCVGELKLETVSYTQNPGLFIKVLKSYVKNGITSEQFSGKTENTLRQNAEKQVELAFKNSPLKKWKFKKILANARELVSARENLRYERTRAFGIVREIFSHIGNAFFRNGAIENPRDVFYLTKEEIFSYVEGTSVTQNIRGLIAFRKAEFVKYQSLEPPAERFATYGAVYSSNDFFDTAKIEVPEGDLKGIGCSPGFVRGKVRVVLDPNENHSMNGDILVAASTDPGWVTLFTSASGIVVERGSLLSHSAIVSREMGKPCIVGVTGLLKRLKTGDEIEMNGSTGTIRILNEQ